MSFDLKYILFYQYNIRNILITYPRYFLYILCIYFFFLNPDYPFEKTLRKLKEVNWRRDCGDWAMRTIRANGRMINNEEAITLTCNVLKRYLNIPLDEFEQAKETAFLDRK